MRRLYLLVILYGVLNAASYCLLLPLWEGFDEAYHYGYVQLLSNNLRLPALGEATLSREIWHAFELVPVSHYLQPYTGAPVNFEDYFAYPESERVSRRRQLESLPREEENIPQLDKPNYEVNQSPLAYLFMAGIDRCLAAQTLIIRVLALRLISSILAVVLIGHAGARLGDELHLPYLFSAGMLFCVFSSQMLYATLCHVCNDVFAPPAMAFLLLTAIAANRIGRSREWFLFGVALAAALLIKAYFLFVVPLGIFALAWGFWRRRMDLRKTASFLAPVALLAGPWYIRNLLLYRNLSGTVASTSGVGLRDVWQGALALPWLSSIRYMAHSSLWTGNNSFTTFSQATLNFELLLLAFGVVLYFVHSRRAFAEWIVIAAAGLFSCGLALVSISFFMSTHGLAIGAVPWYMQTLLLPVLLINFIGLSRAPKWGRILAPLSIGMWTYVLGATYIAKLIPLYGGLELARAHPAALWTWYLEHAHGDSILATVCPGNLTVLKTLVAATLLLGATLCGSLMRRTARLARIDN